MTRDFHLGDILSVTTERLLSPRGMAGVHELLDYMTGDRLLTHQLPRACNECAPPLLEQHPQLAEVNVPEEFGGEAAVMAWLDEQTAAFGESLSVAPLAPDDHTRIDPVTELRMMRPDIPITVIVRDPGGRP